MLYHGFSIFIFLFGNLEVRFFDIQPLLQASIRGLKSMNESEGKEEVPKPVVKRGPRYIQPTLENFRRSKLGFRLMFQEVSKLITLQSKTMPKKSMLNLEGSEVSWSFSGRSGQISMSELQIKVPAFFDSYFVNTRRRIDFGARVQKWINDVEKALEKYNCKGLHELIFAVATSELAKTKGFEQESSSDGEEE